MSLVKFDKDTALYMIPEQTVKKRGGKIGGKIHTKTRC